MQCPFSQDNVRTIIDSRKCLLLKRRSKKYAKTKSVTFYLPIYEEEVKRLGLSENSLIRAEISKIEEFDSVSRPAHEAELIKFRTGIEDILNEYSDATTIRKVPLAVKIRKVLNSSVSRIQEDAGGALLR